MGISQITSAVLVFVTGLLPASCHKSTESAKGTPSAAALKTNATLNLVTGNIGQISLTNRSEVSVLFANGASCTLTPKVVDSQNIQITLALETHKEDGDTKEFTVKQVVARDGKPMEVAVGNMNISFTPVMAEK